MEPRTLATVQAAGRVALGAALVLAPASTAGPWVGAVGRRPGATVIAQGMGARDVGLGIGQLAAVRRGFGAAPWIRAGVIADAVDCIATVRRRSDLPAAAAAAVAALAASSALLGAYLQASLD